MTALRRPRALITGASGGMGRACARLFAATHALVLTDASGALDAFAAELAEEGHEIAGVHRGDLGAEALIAAIAADLTGDLPIAIVHTAGLSPAQADARAIMAVNLVATVKLVDALEPLLVPGSVAVLIASTAGHILPSMPQAAELAADPLAPDFLDAMTALIDGMTQARPAAAPGLSYSLSKQAVLTLVERRARAWGARGARIMSVSPGMIATPMGRKELAETDVAAQLLAATPAGRAGTALDIALAVRFLASPEASFVSGSDLKVDGGGIAATRYPEG